MDDHNGPTTGPAPLQDSFSETLASAWAEWHGPERASPPPAVPAPGAGPPDRLSAVAEAGVTPAAHAGPEFAARAQYRRSVLPAAIAFLGWYVAYVIAATAAPGLMGRPVAGVVNVAILAGFGQFAITFLLTWAYARHARLVGDQAGDQAGEEPQADAAVRTTGRREPMP